MSGNPYLPNDYKPDPPGERKWSPEQAWYLIKSLSENGSLRYNEILLTNTFASSLSASASSGESALEALTAAELLV